MVKIEKEYTFEGMLGEATLRELFDGRPQLVVYHFMYHAGKKSFCNGCSMMVDNMGHPAHLHARGVSRALITRAPMEELIPFQRRMAWRERMYSSAKNSFNDDFGVTTPNGEVFGLSVFLQDGDDVYLTYFTDGRGVEHLGSNFTFLDLAPYGRQEHWEDSPDGWPQTPPYDWWCLHDEYSVFE